MMQFIILPGADFAFHSLSDHGGMLFLLSQKTSNGRHPTGLVSHLFLFYFFNKNPEDLLLFNSVGYNLQQGYEA